MQYIKTLSDKKTICKPKSCPTCGGLGCFERPRYFCGQLLTDKDLDAAQRYVIEKNRLHNRYLVGMGVVCGLIVGCDPCDECSVVIEPGYAIDCCGNDIVVCEPAPFNVCEYIEKCLREKDPACEDKIRLRTRCDDLPKEYCLIVSYNEEPARPITAMVRSNGCSVSRCEPSRTKEIYRFDLIEKKDDKDSAPHNDFWSKVKECFAEFLKQSQKFFDELKKATGNQDTQVRHTALLSLLCRMGDDILKLYKNGPNVRCTVADKVREIEDSFPTTTNDPQYSAKAYNALFRMYGYLLQFTIDCMCDALLVPCTECGDEEGVLLACLTVLNNKIEKICNIVRKQVLTGPALRYFLQPLYTGIDKLLDYICCELNLSDVFDRIFQIRPAPVDNFTGSADNEAEMAERVRSTFIRSRSAFSIGRDYSMATLRSLRTANLLQFTNPKILTAMDVYNRPLSEVGTKLKEMGIAFEEKPATNDAEAYALSNLRDITWVVPPQSSVELVTSPDNLVTAIRVTKEEK